MLVRLRIGFTTKDFFQIKPQIFLDTFVNTKIYKYRNKQSNGLILGVHRN